MEYKLTTIDNPFNPFSQFDEWYAYDISKGYNTLGYLARITNDSDELPEAYQDAAIKSAIDEILEENVTGMYTKAYPPEGESSAS